MPRPTATKTFSNGPSSSCKGSEGLNPVGAARYHVFAAKVVNAIRMERQIKFLSEYSLLTASLYLLCDKSQLLLPLTKLRMVHFGKVGRANAREKARDKRRHFVPHIRELLS